MLKTILPYVLLILSFWYFPEFYLFSKNASNYIYREAVARRSNSVEIKVVEQFQYLPRKYAVLNVGKRGLRVELINNATVFSRSAPIREEEGTAIINDVPSGEYVLHIGKEVNFFPEEFEEIEHDGDSVFNVEDLIPVSIKTVIIKGDTFLAPIVEK